MTGDAPAKIGASVGTGGDSSKDGRLGRLNVAERQFQQGLQAIKVLGGFI